MAGIPIRSAELLAVGTELLLGEIVDTNSAFLARELAERSVDVYWSQRVGDNRGRITEALRAAVGRSDLVLLCGGLGPTDDDLTREAIADLVGQTPQVDPALEATLRGHFARMGRTMPLRNLKQAWLIPAAHALDNPNGTAPGWFVRLNVDGRERVVAALPGPPHELQPMWRDQVAPRLAFPGARFVSRTFKTFGLGESHIADLLDAYTQSPNPSVATYAKRDGVHVRVAAKADDLGRATALLGPVAEAVGMALADTVWGGEQDELAGRALQAVSARGGRLALIDCATGGRLSALLSEAGSEDPAAVDAGGDLAETFAGGVIAWRDDALAVLGVSHAARPPLPDGSSGTAGAASDAAAQADDQGTVEAVHLARAACARFSTDHGVALGPWRPGTSGGPGATPGWAASWAVVGPGGVAARRLVLPAGGRARRDERLAFAALFGLWSLLK